MTKIARSSDYGCDQLLLMTIGQVTLNYNGSLYYTSYYSCNLPVCNGKNVRERERERSLYF